MNAKRIVVCLASALLVGSALAVEPTARIITNNGSTVYGWDTKSIWQDEYVPMDPNDVVSLDCGNGKNLYLTFPKATDFAIDSIVAAPTNTMLRFLFGAGRSRLTVRQLEGYNSWFPIGWWNNGNWVLNSAESGFDFTGTKADPSILPSFYLGTLPYFGVPEATGAAQINRLLHAGMFEKGGPGELTVKGAVGPASGAFIYGGSLVLDTKAESRDDVPAAGAFCHLDASLASSLRTVDGGDGRTYVTNWLDATGNGFFAYNVNEAQREYATFGRPSVAEKTVNGRPLLDFGYYAANTAGPDPERPSAVLKWSESTAAIREIFMAVEVNQQSTAQIAVFGINDYCPFLMHCQPDSVFEYRDVMRLSDVRVNGAPVLSDGDASVPTEMRIISCRTPWPVSANWFGRVAYVGCGGFMLGEALAYTNVLTEAERRQTIAYLKKRWLDSSVQATERQEWDLAEVALDAEDAAIGVPAGGVARVRRVEDLKSIRGERAGVLTKTGDGTLEVDRIVPADTEIAVKGGKVRLTNRAGAASTLALPDDPEFNFDASDADSFTYDASGAPDVMAWHDVRPASSYVATNALYGSGETAFWPDCPKRVLEGANVSPTGLPTVDFSAAAINYQGTANPRLYFAQASVYDGFIVWKNTYDKAIQAPHFSHTAQLFNQRTKNCLIGYKNNQDFQAAAGGTWRVDGLTINPVNEDFGALHGDGDPAATEWHVINFSSTKPIMLDAIAATLAKTSGGGCLVAQYVGYSRPLTDTERRSAEAYLMKRWLGKDHPDNVAWQGSIAFDKGVANEVDSDVDLTLQGIGYSSDAFVKSGSGSLAIGDSVTNLASVAVKGGLLTATLPGDLCADAVFHFDASQTNTLEMVSNGDGTYAISKWYDVRMNGLLAEADTTHCLAKPVYRFSDGTDGLTAGCPYIDFGEPCGNLNKLGYLATNETSASFSLGDGCLSVREVHLVWNDHGYDKAATKYGTPLGNNTSTSSQSGFIRSGLPIQSSSYNLATDIFIDGSDTSFPQTTNKGDGFQVITLVVTGKGNFGAADVGLLKAFANDRNLTVGGLRLAEVVVFDTVQTPTRRAEIDAMLLKKWRGIGSGAAIPLTMPKADVAAGATLDVTSVGVDGVVSADEIAIGVGNDGTSGEVRVAGVYDMSRPCKVTVDVSPSARLGGTRIRVLDAAALINAEGLSGWTLSVPTSRRWSAHLSLDEAQGDVYVEFVPYGMLLIVR